MADKVTMKALDTMHMSNVRADNLQAGDVFQVSEAEAKILEDRGLAERGGKTADALNAETAATDRPDTRDEIDADRNFEEGKAIGAAPANKQIAPPTNKATAPARRARRGR